MAKDELLIRTGDTAFDKIYAYYINPDKYPLSVKHTELKQRWLAAFTLRQNFKSRQQASFILCEKFGIKRAQAFIDLRNAEKLFGNVMKSDRQGSLAILSEYSHKFYQMAMHKRDLLAVGKAIELMAKFAEIDKETNIHFNPDKLENNPIKLTINKEIQAMIVGQLMKGTLDFNNIVDAEAEILTDGDK